MADYAKENAERFDRQVKVINSEAKEAEKGNAAIEKELRKRGRIIHKEQR